MVTVRAATTADVDSLVSIFLSCWRQNYSGVLPDYLVASMDTDEARRLWQTALSSDQDVAVVTGDDGQVKGMIRFHKPTCDEAHVESLYVDPESQGMGAGRALLAHAESVMGDRGAKRMTLWVFESNLGARKFYERTGWISEGSWRVQPRFGQPELGLVRTLSGSLRSQREPD